jgi:outer membrane protein
MNRSQLVLLGIALLTVVGIYQLPKAVVAKKSETPANTTPKTTESKEAHQAVLDNTQSKKLEKWKKAIQESQVVEKKRIFADSIAMLFKQINKIDSAAYYYEQALQGQEDVTSRLRIADTWFEAYRFAVSVDVERANKYGAQARKGYEKILETNPKLYKAKINAAMTYVSVPSKEMTAALSLREVLAEDPKNELALFNLGLLSIQTNQFEKAVARFDTLLQINPAHIEAKMMLAECLLNKPTPDRIRAKRILTEISQTTADSLGMYRQIAKETLDKMK